MLSKSTDMASAHTLKGKMTEEQRRLWCDFLRSYPVPFRRRKAAGGDVADFYCRKAGLVVSLDDMPQDEQTANADNLKFTALHFSNNDVWRNFEGVCEKIDRTVQEKL